MIIKDIEKERENKYWGYLSERHASWSEAIWHVLNCLRTFCIYSIILHHRYVCFFVNFLHFLITIHWLRRTRWLYFAPEEMKILHQFCRRKRKLGFRQTKNKGTKKVICIIIIVSERWMCLSDSKTSFLPPPRLFKKRERVQTLFTWLICIMQLTKIKLTARIGGWRYHQLQKLWKYCIVNGKSETPPCSKITTCYKDSRK